MQRDEAFRNLRSVREEYDASVFSLAEALRAIGEGSTASRYAARKGISREQLERCRGSLEATYTVRLFAEFEGILLDYWRNGCGRRTKPRMEVLVNRIADVQHVSATPRREAHQVRNYRNDIVHKLKTTPPLAFEECMKRMGRFLAFFPPGW